MEFKHGRPPYAPGQVDAATAREAAMAMRSPDTTASSTSESAARPGGQGEAGEATRRPDAAAASTSEPAARPAASLQGFKQGRPPYAGKAGAAMEMTSADATTSSTPESAARPGGQGGAAAETRPPEPKIQYASDGFKMGRPPYAGKAAAAAATRSPDATTSYASESSNGLSNGLKMKRPDTMASCCSESFTGDRMGPSRSGMSSKSSRRKGLTGSYVQSIEQAQLVKRASKEDDSHASDTSNNTSVNFLRLSQSAKDTTGEQQLRAKLTKEAASKSLNTALSGDSQGLKTGRVFRRDLVKAVVEDEAQFKTCLKIPMTIWYTAVFIMFFQVQSDTPNMYVQESAIRTALGAPESVETREDVIHWMEGTLFPYLWSHPNVGSAGAPRSDSGGSRLVAGAELVQARGPVEACSDVIGNASMAPPCTPIAPRTSADSPAFLDWEWVPAASFFNRRRLMEAPPTTPASSSPRPKRADVASAAATQPVTARTAASSRAPPSESRQRRLAAGFSGPKRRLSSGGGGGVPQAETRRLDAYMNAWNQEPTDPRVRDGVYRKVVPMSLGIDDLREFVRSLRNETAPVLDASTAFFSVEFSVVNEAISRGVLSHCVVSFMFSRGGTIMTSVSIQSMCMELGGFAFMLVGLWVVTLAYWSVTLAAHAWVARKHGALRATFAKFSMIVDLLVSVCGWGLVALVAYQTMGASHFQSLWRQYSGQRITTPAAELPAFDSVWETRLTHDLDDTRGAASQLVTLVAAYNLLLLLRFLNATSGQKRLAMVMDTLVKGSGDLAHLLFLFMIIFMAYVMSGHILFGRRMQEFSTWKGSFGYCLWIVFQREFDMKTLTDEELFVSMVWLVSFVLALVLIGVNIFLAILFEKYREVRESVDPSDTVWAYARRLLLELRNQSVWLSNTDLLREIMSIPSEHVYSLAELYRRLEDIPLVQLRHLFGKAMEVRRKNQIRDSPTNQMSTYIASLMLTLEEMRSGLRHMNSAPERQHLDGSDDDEVDKASRGKVEGEEVQAAAGSDSGQEIGVPPREKPTWVSQALMAQLQKQQELMAEMMPSIEVLQAQAAVRGVAVDALGPPPPLPPPASLRHRAPAAVASSAAVAVPPGGVAMQPSSWRRTNMESPATAWNLSLPVLETDD